MANQTDTHITTRKRTKAGRFAPPATPVPGDMAVAIELLRDWRRAPGTQRAVAVRHTGETTLHSLGERRLATYADPLDAALAVAEDRIKWVALPPVLPPRGSRPRARRRAL